MILVLGLGAVLLLIVVGAAHGTEIVDTVQTAVETHLDSWTAYDSLYQSAGASWGVDWHWIKAFALNESSNGTAASVVRGIENPLDAEASKSSDGKSWGIMQMTLSTALGLDGSATTAKLNDPAYSINLGAEYISDLRAMFDQNDPRYTEWVVKSYNQGPGNTRKEIAGTGGGFADEYWARWQRNLTKVQGGTS